MKSARTPRHRQLAGGGLWPPTDARRGARRLSCETLEDRQLLTASPSQWEPALWTSETVTASPATTATLSDPVATPQAGTSSPNGFTPAQLKHAYGFDQISFNGGTIQGDGTGQTIAIVTAYHAPTAQADLLAFSTYFGLPAPPNFTQVSQTGSTTMYPGTDPAGAGTTNWELETALDVQWAHAMAPGANILLVEANSAAFSDLTTAVTYAKNQPGVSVISLSWGAAEFSSETAYDSYFTTPPNHAGVAFVAASGDGGGPGTYPAYSPNVLAVGGTTLTLNGANNISNETAWSGSGGGISKYEPPPSYQNGVVTQSTSNRTMPDVAFLGNPSTGVPVYDSYNNGTSSPWIRVGGTSFGSPVWSALVAIADQGRTLAGLPVLDSSTLLSKIYAMPASNFNDITSGTSGGSTPQAAAVGYDLVTGRGSPKANLVVGSLVGTAAISGTVYDDVNGNGALDAEAGLAGWTVYADLNHNGTFDAAQTNTYASTDVPKTIPSIGTITSNNVISGIAGNVIDVNVTVNITHPRDNSLVLTLISPTGTRITLASSVGGNFGANFTNTVFDDSTAVAISLGTAPFAGSYQPANPLSALFGANPNGTWQLEVQDTVSGNSGVLNSWSLQLTTGDPSTTTDANGGYALLNLPAGSYDVREVLQPGYAQTAPVGGFFSLNVTAGANLTGQNFGNQISVSSTPTAVTLLAGSDTGVSNSDNLTRLNNSSVSSILQFQVTGTVAGATVSVYSDGVLIGSALASGTTTIVTTDSVTTLADGVRMITARQTEPSKPASPASPALVITVDTTAPTASFVPVSPNPRSSALGQAQFNFSEQVAGVDLAQLSLTRDGGANLLSGAQSVTSGNNINWTLADLTSLTGAAGLYSVLLGTAGITDLAGNSLASGASTDFTVLATALARQLFYNNSKYDGNNSAANASDDAAIASDKVALLPGAGAATFANVSSYTRGINGIMIDLAGSHPNITAADFSFKLGNNNTPSSWSTAPAPASVTVRAGAGISGSDRIELLWADGAIQNTWLQVTVAANANTGLAAADVFYFGNAVGDSGLGDTATLASVSVTDELGARNNPQSVFNNIPTSNIFDYNRDGAVNVTDALVARNRPTNIGNAVRLISISDPPAAPLAAPSTALDASAAASSAAATSTTSAAGSPKTTHQHALADIAQQLAGWLQQRGVGIDEQLLDVLAAGRHGSSRRR